MLKLFTFQVILLMFANLTIIIHSSSSSLIIIIIIINLFIYFRKMSISEKDYLRKKHQVISNLRLGTKALLLLLFNELAINH